MPSKPKFIIDTDPGIDDAMALIMILEAHKNGLLEVLAITTVRGNTTIDNVNINMYRILEVLDMTEIPVYSGASQGLVSEYIAPERPFHGHDGFGDVLKEEPPSSISLIQKEPASLALIRIVEENPGEVIMIALGPLTNLAIALNVSPTWTSLLKDFYVMGGTITGTGNISLCGEFNFVCDAEAAKVVLERTKIPIKLLPWEPCLHPLHVTYEERVKLGEADTPAAMFINKIETNHKTRYGRYISCDQLTVAWALHDHTNFKAVTLFPNQELVTRKDSFYATVELTGNHTRGQMVIDNHNCLGKEKNIICLKEVHKDLYLEYLQIAFQKIKRWRL